MINNSTSFTTNEENKLKGNLLNELSDDDNNLLPKERDSLTCVTDSDFDDTDSAGAHMDVDSDYDEHEVELSEWQKKSQALAIKQATLKFQESISESLSDTLKNENDLPKDNENDSDELSCLSSISGFDDEELSSLDAEHFTSVDDEEYSYDKLEIDLIEFQMKTQELAQEKLKDHKYLARELDATLKYQELIRAHSLKQQVLESDNLTIIV